MPYLTHRVHSRSSEVWTVFFYSLISFPAPFFVFVFVFAQFTMVQFNSRSSDFGLSRYTLGGSIFM